MSGIGDFTLPGLRGGTIALADYAGQAMLVANTASLCGFTGQYAGLQRLWESYKDRGLVVLAVPSADFGGQEHRDPMRTMEVCDRQFGVTFPVAATSRVKGREAIPLFQWIGEQAGMMGRPKWNFYKYVIGRDGRLVDWFSSVTAPDSTGVRTAVERALKPV